MASLSRLLAPAARPALDRAAPSPRAVLALLARWYDLWMQRRDLRRLDERMLRDIGITREQARQEADRPFWEEPRRPW